MAENSKSSTINVVEKLKLNESQQATEEFNVSGTVASSIQSTEIKKTFTVFGITPEEFSKTYSSSEFDFKDDDCDPLRDTVPNCFVDELDFMPGSIPDVNTLIEMFDSIQAEQVTLRAQALAIKQPETEVSLDMNTEKNEIVESQTQSTSAKSSTSESNSPKK